MVSVKNTVGRHPLNGVQEAVDEDRLAVRAAKARLEASKASTLQHQVVPDVAGKTSGNRIAPFASSANRGRSGAPRSSSYTPLKAAEDEPVDVKGRERSRSGGDENELTSPRKIIQGQEAPQLDTITVDEL